MYVCELEWSHKFIFITIKCLIFKIQRFYIHLRCLYLIGYSVYCCSTQKSFSESEYFENTSMRLSPGENCFLTKIVGQHLENGVASGVYYNPILIIGLLIVTSFCVLG